VEPVSPVDLLLLLRSMMAVQPGPAKALARAVAHKPHRIWDSSSLLIARSGCWRLAALGECEQTRVADATPPNRHHRWQAFGCYYSLLKVASLTRFLPTFTNRSTNS